MFKRIFHLQLYAAIDENLVQRVTVALRKYTFFKPQLLAVSISAQQGTLVQARNLSYILQKYAAQKDVPFYTFADDVVMGPALHVLCSGVKVYANPFTLIGDVSFQHQSFGFPQAYDHIGFEVKQFVSQKHQAKLSPYAPLNSHDKQWYLANRISRVQGILETRQQSLLDDLSKIRGLKAQSTQALLEKPLLTAPEAKNIGLVDELARLEDIAELRFSGLKRHVLLKGATGKTEFAVNI